MAEVLGSAAAGNDYYLLAAISVVIILILFRNYRKHLFIFAILGIVIANPWFKDLWQNKLKLMYYWRMLWVVPVIPLCAALPPMIAEKISNKSLKGFIALAFAGLFYLTGSAVYKNEYCKFTFPADNMSKISKSAEILAKELLQMDENPRVIADRRVAYYIREYDGKIQTLFGRDAYGYIWGMNETAILVNREINKQEDGDMQFVADAMRKNNYKYLISVTTVDERMRRLEDAGFRQIFKVSHWGIFVLSP